MAQKLPRFEGKTVEAGSLAYSGSVDDSDMVLHVGDEVTQIVKGRVTGVAHKQNQFGVMKRVHSITLDFTMEADKVTEKRINKEHRRMLDEAEGQTSMDEAIEE